MMVENRKKQEKKYMKDGSLLKEIQALTFEKGTFKILLLFNRFIEHAFRVEVKFRKKKQVLPV